MSNASFPRFRLSLFVFRTLLYGYPRVFRKRFARQMVEDFRELLAQERTHGPVRGRVYAWLIILRDIFASLPREHLHAWRDQRAVDAQARPNPTSSLMDTILQDLRFAVRVLRRRPFYASSVMLILGLGIGAASALYAIADSVLFRKLPYPDLDRLVSVSTIRSSGRESEAMTRLRDRSYVSYEQFRRWREGSSLFEAVALFRSSELEVTVAGSDVPEMMAVGAGTSSLLTVLGIQPTVGRWFLAGEDGYDAEPIVVLGDRLWRERFNADPGVLGSTLTVDDRAYTVIGVAPPQLRLRKTIDWRNPPGFSLWRSADVAEKDLWFPVGFRSPFYLRYANHEGIGRLRSGILPEQAEGEIGPLLRGERPPEEIGVRLELYADLLKAGLRSQVLLLAIPSMLLLFIALSNMATLLLGNTLGRGHEFLTRAALGASRGRVTRLLLTESVLLGLLGGIVGALLAVACSTGLVAMAPPASPMEEVGASGAIVLVSCSVGVLGGLVTGLVSILLSPGGTDGVAQHSPRQHSRPGRGLQRKIVMAQVGMTVAILVGATLLTRTLTNLLNLDLGFETQDLAVARMKLLEYGSDGERLTAQVEILERVAALPGVDQVAMAYPLPFAPWGGDRDSSVRLEYEADPGPQVHARLVSPQYHELMRIQLLEGRYLSGADDMASTRVAVVSEHMARNVWPGRSAIGQRFRCWNWEDWHTVVGVVEDVRHHGFVEGYVPTVYGSLAQHPGHGEIVARAGADAASLSGVIRAAIEEVTGRGSVREIATMESFVSRKSSDQFFRALFTVGFGLVAVVLAAGGIFSIAARDVAAASREIGIRKALGAREGVLVWDVVRTGIRQAVVGVSLGLVVALAGSRFVASFLFGVSATEPITYAAVGSFLIFVSSVAAFMAARRIACFTPAEALRAE